MECVEKLLKTKEKKTDKKKTNCKTKQIYLQEKGKKIANLIKFSKVS